MGIFYSEIQDDFRHILNCKGVCNIPDSYLVFMSRKMLLFFYHKKTEEITFLEMDKWLTAFVAYTRKYKKQIKEKQPIQESFDPDNIYMLSRQRAVSRSGHKTNAQRRRFEAEGNIIIQSLLPQKRFLLLDIYNAEQHHFDNAEEAASYAGTKTAALYRSLRQKKMLNKKYLVKKAIK